MSTTLPFLLCLISTHFVSVFTFAGAKVPAIIAFGDSSIDTGNNNFISTMARSNFKPYGRDFDGGLPTGRFSNGRIGIDFISEKFGIKPTIPAYLNPSLNISDFATGVTFASAASGYDNVTADVLSVIPLWKELGYYKDYQKKLRAFLGRKRATRTIASALHITSLGTNDFMENYYTIPGRSARFTIGQYQNFLVEIAGNFHKTLYELGARKISVVGLPPMGCMPLVRATNLFNGGGCVKAYNDVAVEFNGKLKSLVLRQNKELHGVKIVFANPYDSLMSIITKPASYGFDVAETGCCGTGMFEMSYSCDPDSLLTCADANKYVFWDSFHPSEKTNQILAHDLVKNDLAVFL